MLSDDDAVACTRELLAIKAAEASRLDVIHAYFRGSQALPISPSGAPAEVRKLAKMSRINICRLVVGVPAQSLFVCGFRQPASAEEEPGWTAWQANRMDAKQTGVHRAALCYGTSYVSVLNDAASGALMRGYSPREMTTAYSSDDDDWPVYALRSIRTKSATSYRLFDEDATYDIVDEAKPNAFGGPRLTVVSVTPHGMGCCPIVRFRSALELDADDQTIGEIEPVMPLQDQMDFTTFDLLVAQHFAAFRQRYVIGWTAPDETTRAKAAASRLWTFEDEVKVGEFGQTDLGGYLESREATMRHMAIISQVPPHELLGQMVNLSAEALAAAEANHRRKCAELEILFGESWEQVFELEATTRGEQSSPECEVRWRDTESRTLAATVDALGKLAVMLGVPTQVLWEKIPGWTDQDVARAKAAAQSGDYFAQLDALLTRQAAPTSTA